MNISEVMKKHYTHLVLLTGLFIYLALANFLFDTVLTVKNENSLQDQSLPKETSNLVIGLETIEQIKVQWKDLISFRGWAYISEKNTTNNKTFVVLKSTNNTYVFDTKEYLRYDLPVTFKKYNLNLEKAGFTGFVSKGMIKDGAYRVGILVINGPTKVLTYTKEYFTKKSDVVTSGFISSEQKFALPNASVDLLSAVDVAKKERDNFEIAGWAFNQQTDSYNNTIYLVLKSNKGTYIFDTALVNRPDITNGFAKKTNLNFDNSGFRAIIPVNAIGNGNYQIGMCIKNGDRIIYSLSTHQLVKNVNTIELTN